MLSTNIIIGSTHKSVFKRKNMQEPLTTIDINFNNIISTVKVYGNVDKIEGYCYYSFEFNENNKIVISKFDGIEWKIANKILNDDLAVLLGEIIDKVK